MLDILSWNSWDGGSGAKLIRKAVSHVPSIAACSSEHTRRDKCSLTRAQSSAAAESTAAHTIHKISPNYLWPLKPPNLSRYEYKLRPNCLTSASDLGTGFEGCILWQSCCWNCSQKLDVPIAREETIFSLLAIPLVEDALDPELVRARSTMGSLL